VTGGSRGIGKMIAAGFLSHGAAKVYITARKAGPCEATAKELTAEYGGECIALPIDIATVAGCEQLIHLTRRMAAKLIGDHVVVTGIAPGPFASDTNRAARDHADEVALREPSRRIGTTEDMAGAAIFLASRAGDYVVGTTLAVDGGIVYARAGAEIAG